MRTEKVCHPLRGERGAGLLIVIVTVSILIFVFMASAGFKLMEVSKQSANINEKLKYANIIEDLSQIVARAYILGKSGSCPAGTTSLNRNFTVVGAPSKEVADQPPAMAAPADEAFCFPNSGVTGVGGINGICVDLDQNAATLNDNYCLETLNLITQNQFEEDLDKKYAKNSEVKNKLHKILLSVFNMSSAYACQWWGGGTCAPGNGTNTMGPVAPIVSLSVPSQPIVTPAGAAIQQTPDSPVEPRNNDELWSPNLTAAQWSPTNEIFTPDCTNPNDYYRGCIRCRNNADNDVNPNVRCIRFTVCRPPHDPLLACPASEQYSQVIAILLRDRNL